MKRLLFNLSDFIEVLETFRDYGDVNQIIITEHEGYPMIADAEDPETHMILKPAEEDEDNTELH